MRGNKVKEILSTDDGVAFGTFIQMASPENAELATYSGFDYVIVDTEHGYFGIETAVSLVRAIESGGGTSLIRVPNQEPTEILKALDAGAMGVVVPGVENKKQAEAAVKAAKFPPLGSRGACPWTRSTGHGLYHWEKYVKWTNKETLVWLIIENEEAISNIEDILDVDGVDAIGLGPFDLSVSLGLEGEINHPIVIDKLTKITKQAREKGKEVNIAVFAQDIEGIKSETEEWINRGSRIISVGTDRAMLNKQYRDCMSAIKSYR